MAFTCKGHGRLNNYIDSALVRQTLALWQAILMTGSFTVLGLSLLVARLGRVVVEKLTVSTASLRPGWLAH